MHRDDRVEKTIDLAAPVSRVWQALTDYRQFCTSFRAELDGPFAPGSTVRGHSTYPGYEHVDFELVVQKAEPERLFSFTWPAYAGCSDPACYTLVEFTLEPSANGTLLRVVESGFERVPSEHRAKAYRDNDGGWSEQMQNISEFLLRGA